MIRPLHDRVIVKRKDAVSKTSSGIVLPDISQERPAEGIVIAVGNGRLVDGVCHPLDVKIGDEVLFGKYSGSEVTLNNEDFLIMREDEILGVIE